MTAGRGIDSLWLVGLLSRPVSMGRIAHHNLREERRMTLRSMVASLVAVGVLALGVQVHAQTAPAAPGEAIKKEGEAAKESAKGTAEGAKKEVKEKSKAAKGKKKAAEKGAKAKQKEVKGAVKEQKGEVKKEGEAAKDAAKDLTKP